MNSKKAICITPGNVYHNEQVRNPVLNFLSVNLPDESKMVAEPHKSSSNPALYIRRKYSTISALCISKKYSCIPVLYTTRSSRNHVIYIRTKSRSIPALYRRTNAITLSLLFMGILCMYLDIFLSITELGVSVYVVWCLSCFSMFYTNKIALKEWKSANGWEKSEK